MHCARWLATQYDRYGARSYSLALHILKDPAMAEDAVVDAFQALRHAQNPDPLWLECQVLRLTRDSALQRLLLRRPGAALASIPGELAPGRFADALARLPHLERTVLELEYFEGQSVPAIADQLGQPAEEVHAARRSAMRALRAVS